MKNSKLKNVHGGIFFSDGIHAATDNLRRFRTDKDVRGYKQ